MTGRSWWFGLMVGFGLATVVALTTWLGVRLGAFGAATAALEASPGSRRAPSCGTVLPMLPHVGRSGTHQINDRNEIIGSASDLTTEINRPLLWVPDKDA